MTLLQKPVAAAKPLSLFWDNRNYVLLVLLAVYAANIADRYVVSTLIEPIKAEFHLSDSAVGFLTGSALAIFYVTAGIPLGVLADRVNRRNMIALSLAAWSALTLICGLTRSFTQLLIARIGVGVGEAGGTPPSLTLLSDRVPPRLRSAATTVLTVGSAIGATAGTTGGGWLSDHYGWRAALIVFGLAGMPLALLVRATIREPKRGALDDNQAAAVKAGFGDTLRFIARQRSLVHIFAGKLIVTFWGWGLIWWTPAFLARSHHLSPGAAGALLGPMHLLGGTAAMLATAWAMQRFANRPPRLQTRFVGIIVLIATVPSILVYGSDSMILVQAMLWVFLPVTYFYIGPTFALIQNLVLPGMRAQGCAVSLFVSNIANLVLAPQLIGLASDLIAPRLANPAESLRYALIGAAFTGFWGAAHFFAAERSLSSDLARVGIDPPRDDPR
jgi:predicted MFS family arabinose efflux permease